MTAASYATAFRLLFLSTAEHAEEGNYEASVGWTLVEADLVADEALPRTSEVFDFLHA